MSFWHQKLRRVARDSRFYCRRVIIHNLGLDDWIMFIALV